MAQINASKLLRLPIRLPKESKPSVISTLVILFLGLAYTVVIITVDNEENFTSVKLDDVKSEKPHSTSHFFDMLSFYTKPKDTCTVDHHTTYSTTCRRPLLSLWTQSPELLNSRSFPDCPNFFQAIEKGTYWGRRRVFRAVRKWKIPFAHSENSVLDTISTCDHLHTDFPDKPASREEAEFPLAYVFTPSRNLAQAVRLFRMIYQPQNAYCINYDTKISAIYKKAIVTMASCFPNVYLNPNPEPIHYAMFSVLHSVMECMKVLRNSTIKWRYVQIVSWNDFPLKTNWEMVKIFKALNGSQDTELIDNEKPFYHLYEAANKLCENNGVLRPVPPAGITIYKGSFANSLTREFVDFMFTDPVSIQFYDYYNNRSICAEEFYWTSLVHNTQLNAPGNFPGYCFMYYEHIRKRKPFLSRFQVWSFRVNLLTGHQCLGQYVHASCVYGVRDLSALLTRMELFAHKLYEEFEPGALYCLEEWYWRRVCMGNTDLNVSYYQNLPSVKYHNLPPSEKESYVCTI